MGVAVMGSRGRAEADLAGLAAAQGLLSVAGLEVLEEVAWIRSVEVKATVRGGRPTTEYLVNPAVRGSGGSVGFVGFVGFDGGSSPENPLARASATFMNPSSSSPPPSNPDIPPRTSLRNLRNLPRDQRTRSKEELAARAREIRARRATTKRGRRDVELNRGAE